MSFLFEYINHAWGSAAKSYDSADLAAWTQFLEAAEKDRQRDRIISWKDRTTLDDYAVNAEQPEYYRRSAGFVWRVKDSTGTHRARNHQYLYNLEVYGHKVFTRRDKADLVAAEQAVASKAAELGPLSPLE